MPPLVFYKESMDKTDIEKLRALNVQYRRLRSAAMVKHITLKSIIGDFNIINESVINKILDLLIQETRGQIKKNSDETK